jgi:hypothetical protein
MPTCLTNTQQEPGRALHSSATSVSASPALQTRPHLPDVSLVVPPSQESTTGALDVPPATGTMIPL